MRFRTKVPDVLLEQRLASWCSWIVNKRAYEERGFDGFSREPVGSGPYKFRSHQRDQKVVLDAFDQYWMGRPNAESVEFRQMPELASRVAALQAGDVDMITNIPPDQVGVLKKSAGIDVRSVVLANVHVLTFDERGPQMGDKRVRQALGACDRPQAAGRHALGRFGGRAGAGTIIPNTARCSSKGAAFATIPTRRNAC